MWSNFSFVEKSKLCYANYFSPFCDVDRSDGIRDIKWLQFIQKFGKFGYNSLQTGTSNWRWSSSAIYPGPYGEQSPPAERTTPRPIPVGNRSIELARVKRVLWNETQKHNICLIVARMLTHAILLSFIRMQWMGKLPKWKKWWVSFNAKLISIEN